MLTESRRRSMKLKITNEQANERVYRISVNADAEYQAYSAQVSPIVRTLALTAIGVIWLFAGARPGGSGDSTPFAVLHRLESTGSLALALILALCALLVDLSQYVWGSLSWGTYRWSLEQILINDNFDPDDLSFRVRLGWLIARLFRVPQHFEYHAMGKSGAALGKSWQTRRSDLRNSLQCIHSRQVSPSLKVALDEPWSPLIINRISLILFLCKIALLVLCYALLGRFLLL